MFNIESTGGDKECRLMQAIERPKSLICQGSRKIGPLNPDLGLAPRACMSIDAGGLALELLPP